MSQHELMHGDIRYVFGWDQPLQSFFLQKHDPNIGNPDANPVLWLGGDQTTRMYEVDDLVLEAAKIGLDIPYRIQVELYGEKDDGR